MLDFGIITGSLEVLQSRRCIMAGYLLAVKLWTAGLVGLVCLEVESVMATECFKQKCLSFDMRKQSFEFQKAIKYLGCFTWHRHGGLVLWQRKEYAQGLHICSIILRWYFAMIPLS